MSDQKPLLSLKKTFFYNFFPSKDEEEACKLINTPHVVTRELIEIRDIYPLQKIDLGNPYRSRKRLPVTRSTYPPTARGGLRGLMALPGFHEPSHGSCGSPRPVKVSMVHQFFCCPGLLGMRCYKYLPVKFIKTLQKVILLHRQY
ncbi:hypothetical protein MTR67_024419 [Solanum verrucosum]|uniref:Uncharacterized protein n=1 Tax=Solanum verrucosum TaxID=315347 RepID=A0AAF0QVB8_SOLVR|nr:hypothetical protein MTR67_024419 [Solanum verrucosum]